MIQAHEYESIARGRHPRPFDVLGAHPHADGGWVVRAFFPRATDVKVQRGGELLPARFAHPDGVFEAKVGDAPQQYRLVVTPEAGEARLVDDPYRFPATLKSEELDAFHRGEDVRAWKRLGAHRIQCEGVDGVRFAVWAPNAERVSVTGDFNDWTGRMHGMRRLRDGTWEIFIPGVQDGACYKYEIRTKHGGRRTGKADPFGFAMELRPNTASVVAGFPPRAAWGDAAWMAGREKLQSHDRPISVYEVHLGSWRRHAEGRTTFLSYAELAEQLIPWAKDLGFTHLQLLPITEHPFDGSWGYQTVGYFAPTSRHGSPAEFAAFIDAAHQADLGVLLDWVPGHFPRDAHGLGFFDGEHLYEPEDPRRGLHQGWGTFVWDFARPEARSLLLSSAMYWLENFHADGLRVDAVASMLYLDYGRDEGEWVPNAEGGRENWSAVRFLKVLSREMKRSFPGALLIAEESTSWPGITATHDATRKSLGFDRKWNMGWMNDTLSFFRKDPLLRGSHLDKLTFGLTYAFEERYVLPLSHDEVVHGKASLLSKMPGEAPEARFANLRLLLGWMWVHPGKKLLFMGAELGQWAEWNHDAELDWHLLEHEPHRRICDYLGELNRLLAEEPALHACDDSWDGFEWICITDEARAVVTLERRGGEGPGVLAVANFSGATWKKLRLAVPREGDYEVLLNSAESRWGGTGAGLVAGTVLHAESEAVGERTHSIVCDVPALSMLWLESPARGVAAECVAPVERL